MNDTQSKIGKLLDESAERDAIHIAVLPVKAGEELYRCEGVSFAYGTRNTVLRSRRDARSIGIVDPFLKDEVKTGQRFFVFLFPNTVTGMRHHWTHPEVDVEPEVPKSDAEGWLRGFAERWDFDYDEMVSAATNPAGWDNVIVARDHDLHGEEDLGGDLEIFWKMMEKLIGRKFEREHQEKVVWSCSC